MPTQPWMTDQEIVTLEHVRWGTPCHCVEADSPCYRCGTPVPIHYSTNAPKYHQQEVRGPFLARWNGPGANGIPLLCDGCS